MIGKCMEFINFSEYNFDHPDSFDYEALFDTLLNLKKGNKVEVPIYDFKTHTRLAGKVKSIVEPKWQQQYTPTPLIFSPIPPFF